MADYFVDPDALYSDDEERAHAHAPPAPASPKRPRPAAQPRRSSALDALDSLDLGHIAPAPRHFGGANGGPRRPPPPRYEPAPPAPAPLGAHMRADAGGAPPARGRPGIHPSRLANLTGGGGAGAGGPSIHPSRLANMQHQQQHGGALRESVGQRVEDDTHVVSRIETEEAALSILSDADRARLKAREAANAVQRKRPGRRRPSAGVAKPSNTLASVRSQGVAPSSGDGMLHKLMASTASRAPTQRGCAAGSANARARPQRAARKTMTVAEREQQRREALMSAVLGKDALQRQKAKDEKARQNHLDDIRRRREATRRSRAQQRRAWAQSTSVARIMRIAIDVGNIERDLFPKRGASSLTALGLPRCQLPHDEQADNICFVNIVDDI